jgi:hypothetical protein
VAVIARTCAATLLGAGGLVAAACGHLPFDEAFDEIAFEGGGPRPDSAVDLDSSQANDGATDVDGDASDAALDGGSDALVGGDDAGCVGRTCIGTFVSATTGDDDDPGTADKPVRTISRAIEIAANLGGHQSVYVAAAHYTEKVTLVEGVSLFGGYACGPIVCAWTRDVEKNDTWISDTDYEGVLAPTAITRQTSFDGFRVTGKAGAPTAAPGGAAITLSGGSPTITRCRVTAGDLDGGAIGAKRSVGVAILAPTNTAEGALLDQNLISGGISTDESVGVLFDTKVGTGNGPAVAVLTKNTIRGGTAPLTSGVLALASGPATILRENDITAGTASNAGNTSSSWAITVASAMTIDQNRINADQTNVGVCAQNGGGNGTPSFCGGIQSLSSSTTITNNVILGVKGSRTCAVLLAQGEKAAGAVVLNANTLDGAGTGNDGSVSAALALRIAAGDSAAVGSVRNNILLGGGNKNRYGIYEEGAAGKTIHPVAIDNNDFWNTPGSGKNDVAYHRWDGSVAHDLSFDELAAANAPAPSGNIDENPLVDATYHLQMLSPCIDKGTVTEAPSHDIDGDPRPKSGGGVFLPGFEAGIPFPIPGFDAGTGSGIDIGADEAK